MPNTPASDSVSEQNRRTRAGRTGSLVVLAFAAMFLFSWMRCTATTGAGQDFLAEGFVGLDVALSTDRDVDWQRAEEGFRQAARQSVFDTYPLFCMTSLDAVREADTPPASEATEGLAAIPVVVRRGERADARQRLIDLSIADDDSTRTRAAYWLRFLGDLEVASARRAKKQK